MATHSPRDDVRNERGLPRGRRRDALGTVHGWLVAAVLAAGLLIVWFVMRTTQMPVKAELRPAQQEAMAQTEPAQLEHTFADAVDGDVRTVLLEPAATTTSPTQPRGEAVAGYRLIGRALDANGNALARAVLQARFTESRDRSNYWSTRSVRLETDENGRFEWRLAQNTECAGRTAWFLKVGAVELYAERALPLVLATSHDLGDVRFEPAPLLVSGRVVDAGGQPIVGANLVLQAFHDVHGKRGSGHAAKHKTTSDSAGAFTMLGHAPVGTLQLQAVGDKDHLPATRKVFAGERDVVLVLADAARIKGRLLLDEGIHPSDLELIVDTTTKSHSSTPDFDGTFELLGLSLGPARLALAGSRWAGPQLELFDLEVVRGGSADPRLDPIDLRGALLQTHVYVEDSNGKLLDTVIVRSRGERPPQELPRGLLRLRDERRTVSNDGSHAFLHAEPVDVDVLAPGMRATPCTLAGRDLRLRVAPGIEVSVRVLGTEQLPQQISAGAVLNIPPEMLRGQVIHTPDARSFTLPSAGAWKGWVDVMFVSDTRVVMTRGQEFLIQVEDSADVQHFEIQIDATTLAHAADLVERHGE